MPRKKRVFPDEVIQYVMDNYMWTKSPALAKEIKVVLGYEISPNDIVKLANFRGLKKLGRGANAGNEKYNVGDIVADSNGYERIKLYDGNWDYRLRVEYRRKVGSIPEGHVVCFRTDDRKDYSKENLVAMPRTEMRKFINNRCGRYGNGIKRSEKK